MKPIKLFEFGADGGGAEVYKLPDNSVIETGSGGGILDDEEDPIRTWERKYDNWEAWWQHFIGTHKAFWINFSPLYIDDEIKPFIREAVAGYNYPGDDLKYRIERWEITLQ